jgi:KaiC/GvpD/RAD55 family RecA-like ATPase
LIIGVYVQSFFIEIAISQTTNSYHPSEYNSLGGTTLVSGSVTDLQTDDSNYMTFRSYPSEMSEQTLYAHQETTTIAGISYNLLKLESVDSAGTNLSVSMASTGRQLWGKFLYPLTGVTSIPASTWTVYYRAWHSNVPEENSTNSPSSIPLEIWNNAEDAYLSDNVYASTSTPDEIQLYRGYGFNLPSTAVVIKVEVGYEAYTDNDEKIGITLSWDNGTTWATEYISPTLGTTDPNTVTWVDFTNATNWTVDKLSDANFCTSVRAVIVSSRDDILLDWFPVRVTYAVPPSAQACVDVLIRKSDGIIRQTIATKVANSSNLTTTAQTLSGTYSWPIYTVVDETDYLEVDYYLNVTVANSGVTAYLRIDDSSLDIVNQTRVAGVLLPSEYTTEIEFTGSSNTDYWSQLALTVDSAWTTDNVSVILQLYNYTLGGYPISGDGYIEYVSSATSNTDETKSQIITKNPKNFRNSSGGWKIKVKGVKSTASQFDFKVDLIRFETTSVAPPDVAVADITLSSTSVYSGEIVTVNVTVNNQGGTTETFNVSIFANTTEIGKQTVLNLAPNKNETLSFVWNTTAVSSGKYIIKAVADTLQDEEDIADNIYMNSYVTILDIHDVAVVKVEISSENVIVGQNVKISVVVKNEGTAAETFNVTAYFNETVIDVLKVVDLQPSEEKSLTFYWNTTGLAGNTRYVIMVITSHVSGETDTLDNELEGGIITLRFSTQPEIPPPIDFSYTLPIGLISVLSFCAGIIWRRKRNRTKFVGFRFFDEITKGGIPEASSVMITGGPSSGKSVLCQQLAFTHLQNGKTCIYISYDCFPDEVRRIMKNFLWDISPYEKEGRFCFIDCYSKIAGVEPREKYSIDQPFSLSDLGITVSEATRNMASKSPMVVLDSTAPLFARIESAKVLEFIQDRSARIKGENGIFLFIVGKGTISTGHMNKLEEIVDCIIELQAIEDRGKIVRRLRVKKLRGRDFLDEWIPFRIESKTGITFLVKKRK